MRALWIFAGLCLLPLALLAEEGRKANRIDLDGTYRIVSGEKDGKPEPKERIEGAVVTIKGNKISMTDKDTKEFSACTFTIDSKKKPHAITMTSTAAKKGEVARGIIEKDGDSVKLCYALPGAAVPTTFTTKKDQHCFVLKKKSRD